MLSLFSVIFRKCENLSVFLLLGERCLCPPLVLVGDGLCCHLGLRGGGDDEPFFLGDEKGRDSLFVGDE